MSIIGVDLGCYTTYVAGIKDGGVEVLANEYSHLPTPTCVSFNTAPRPMGYSSKQQAIPKFKSTCAQFKPLLCRTVEDHGPILDAIPCEVKPVNLNSDQNDLYATVTVMDSKNQPITFTVQQVLAAFLTKLFSIAREATGTHVEECLLAVPYYLTAADRHVIMEAAQIAGFNFIKLINETAALTASYAFFKKATLPAPPEPPKRVVFVDVGYSQAQLILAEVQQQSAKVVLAKHSREVGGFFFDDAIRKYFAEEFMKTKKLDARSNRRAWLRLADEAERAKKSVCAASTKTIAQIECLMEDTDFKAEIDRTLFEQLAEKVFRAFDDLVSSFIAEAKINTSEVEVELVGGSSRVPLIRSIVEQRFGHEAKTTMNQDEAISRGTALMAGLLSPRVRKTGFILEDFAPYTVKAIYSNENHQQRSLNLVSRGEIIPIKKNVTLFIPSVDLAYEESFNCKRPDLYHIARIGLPNTPEPNEHSVEPTKFRFPFSYDLSHFIINNGCIRIDKELVPEEPPKEPSKEDVKEPPAKDEKDDAPKDQQQSPEKPGNAQPQQAPAPPGPPQPRTRETRIDHVMTISKSVNPQVNENYVHQEKAMREDDDYATLKAEAKNSLEGSFFNMQRTLEEDSASFDPVKKENLSKVMLNIEDFLYEDDADYKIEDYSNKLAELQSLYDDAKLPGLKIEEAPSNAEAMDIDPKIEEPQ
jgi:molecular chaperone DnaK (HSP70)